MQGFQSAAGSAAASAAPSAARSAAPSAARSAAPSAAAGAPREPYSLMTPASSVSPPCGSAGDYAASPRARTTRRTAYS